MEDSTCCVHASRGPLTPASPQLQSEVEIVCRIAEATLGDRYGIDWAAMREGLQRHPRATSPGRPGCENYEVNVRQPGGFVMPHPPRDSRTIRHRIRPGRIRRCRPIEALQIPPGHLVLQTLRSHDQYNTTIYGLQRPVPRHRGRPQGDLRQPGRHQELGFRTGSLVDMVTHWPGDRHVRRAEAFRIVGLRNPARVGGCLLSRDQPARPPGLHRSGQQHTDFQVRHHSARISRYHSICDRGGAGARRGRRCHKSYPEEEYLS